MAKKKAASPAATAEATFTQQKLTRGQLILLKDIEDKLKRRGETPDLKVLQSKGLVDETFRVTTLGSQTVHQARFVDNCL